MTYRSALIGVTTAILSVIAVGCAGPATETSGRLADAAGSSSPITQLCGPGRATYCTSAATTPRRLAALISR